MKTRRDTIVFVTGTGTDVGKTVAAAALLAALRDAGVSAQALKPVQTGCVPEADGLPTGDAAVYADACPGVSVATLVSFPEPCSPHLAAAMSGTRLTVGEVAAAVRERSRDADITVVEGAGGLLVPLNREETMAELAALLDAEVVLVVANVLGAINHALLTLESARNKGLRVAAVVLTSPRPESPEALDETIRQDNIAVLKDMGRVDLVVELPYFAALSENDPEARADAWREAAARLRPVAGALTEPAANAARRGEGITAFDETHLWHPYAATTPPPKTWSVRATRGTRIVLEDGRELIDGMSSWWAAVHGYNHPALLEALRTQAGRMPHVMFGGLTHEPAVALGEKLLSLAPAGLSRVFFCDSGSVSVEAALKMAIQYQVAIGKPGKHRIAAPLGGYHGDTLGAMGVCDPVNGMHGLFSGVVPNQVFFDRPACRFGGRFDPDTLSSMEAAFREHGDELAALILEPVVQGAGGMWMYHQDYLRHARRLCDRHGVLLILDEVATGFGRTGKMFAAEWADVAPDILCVGKALTGGCMTLAAVLAREEIARAISAHGVFMHGPTFMANPLACAVARASLDLLDQYPWQERVGEIEIQLQRGLAPCRNVSGVADVRVLGAIGVVELQEPVNAPRLQRFFVDRHGVWIRPFAKLIYVMPPYVSAEKDVAALTAAIAAAVREGEWK